MFGRDPILSIKQFGFADQYRSLKKRIPGMCRVIRNTAPLLYDGESVRRGYAAYTAVTAPTGMEVLKVVPIQSPSQEDVHIWFASNSGQKVYVNPWWQISTKQTTNMQVDEHYGTLSPATISTTNVMTFSVSANSLSTTTDYYRNWVILNGSNNQVAQIASYSVSGNTATVTTVQIIGSTGLAWSTGSLYGFYRNFHDNLSFVPAYNTTLVDPPCVKSENSIVRWSGGQSSTNGNRGIHYTPKLNRTFFPTLSGGINYLGSYISERECKTVDFLATVGLDLGDPNLLLAPVSVGENHIPYNTTLWVAAAPVYDGFQIGKLTRYETVANYFNGNYLSTAGAYGKIKLQFDVNLASLNKRITGIAIYFALDDGHTTARTSPYFFIKYLPFTDSAFVGWTRVSTASHDVFRFVSYFNGDDWSAKGNVYVVDSGYVENPTDTMYSYSDETAFAGKHFLSNTYVVSETFVDRQNLFTNPTGGNAAINAGLNQSDIFSNEQGIYRIIPDSTVGTKITGMIPLGLEELLITRDRGILLGRPEIDPLGFIEFIWTKLSDDVGSATLAQLVQADDGFIYFAGYDDVYRYRQGAYEPLIQHGEKNDWLYTYRESITKSQKESTVIWYLPEGIIYLDIAQTNGFQFAFYPPRILGGERTSNYGWRQVCFNQISSLAATQFFKWMNTLQGGIVIGVTTDSPAVVMQFSDPTTQALYYADAITSLNPTGNPIKMQIDTGDFVPSGTPSLDFRLNKIVFDKAIDIATVGTLDVDIYKDRGHLTTRTNQSKTTERLEVNSLADEQRIGNEWRFIWNSNVASPEVMQSNAKVLQINQIDLYGDVQAFMRRASDTTAQGSEGCLPTLGTINGIREVIITTANTPQTYTFDVPFTETYAGHLGTEPSYRFDIDSAHPVSTGNVENTSVNVAVSIVTKTLTTITLVSPEDNTIVRFSIS